MVVKEGSIISLPLSKPGRLSTSYKLANIMEEVGQYQDQEVMVEDTCTTDRTFQGMQDKVHGGKSGDLV